MALTAANNTMQLTITSTDINGNTSWNRGAGNPTLNGITGEGVIAALLAAGDNSLVISGGGNIFNIYVKNNAAPGGNTITVKATPAGGAQQTLAALQPGGVFSWWQVINTVAAGGYSNVTLNASGANTPCEYFLGN